MEPRDTRAVIRAREWQWLTTEANRWADDGLISQGQREAIVGRYAVDVSAGQRRAFLALTGLAVLVAAIAVLLVIGYNWDAIPRAAKVGTIFGAVTATFAASAVAYARGRTTAGELLAFAGTLFYGNAIWLLAQVYQIRSHYPNGALWWMIGALAAGHLLRSRLIALEAVVLTGVWLLMELVELESVSYLYVPFGALTIWLAYRVRSSWVLSLSALVLTAWTFVMVGHTWVFFAHVDGLRVAVAVGAMCACALYTAGFHHEEGDRFRRVWQNTGLFVLAIFLTPLMWHWFHAALVRRPELPVLPPAGAWPMLAVAAAIVLSSVVATWLHPREARRSWPVLSTLALSAIWVEAFLFTTALTRTPAFGWVMTIAFSAAAASIGVGLIHAGVRGNRGRLFAGGIGYVLLFLVVRWIDLLGSMLWSALFLGATAVALFMLARLWLNRRPADSTGVI